MIRRVAATLKGVVPHIDIEDLVALACLAGLWYGLHLFSEALAWTSVSVIGLALALIVALRRPAPVPAPKPEPPADMTSEQFAALLGRRSVEG